MVVACLFYRAMVIWRRSKSQLGDGKSGSKSMKDLGIIKTFFFTFVALRVGRYADRFVSKDVPVKPSRQVASVSSSKRIRTQGNKKKQSAKQSNHRSK